MQFAIDCSGTVLNLQRPCVMGILNVTPDSFSDGGRFFKAELALRQAQQLVSEGAAIIDIGGESSRPGAQPVPLQEELDRIIPLIEILAQELEVPISVDTSKPEVMQAGITAGAKMINDICALRVEGALNVVSESNAAVCLMHMQGEPRSMQNNPYYTDVVSEVKNFLSERLNACYKAGIDSRRVVVDPGFGFGKTLQHNLQLLKHLQELSKLEVPVLVGISRKSMIGALVNAEIDDRLYGSVAAAVVAVENGASIIRAHDVKPTVDALAIFAALKEAQ